MTYAILSINAPPECITELKKLGFEVVLLPPFKRLSYPTDTHADMLFYHHDSHIVMHKDYYNENKSIFDKIIEACGLTLSLSDEHISSSYPEDILYNALKINNNIFVHRTHTSNLIISTEKDCSPVICKQGYIACSTLVVDDGNVIVSDDNLEKIYKEHGITVTKISVGGIDLHPYDYGFIGGCCGVHDNTVYFCGNIDLHPDADIIKAKILSLNKNYINLYNGSLKDIGSIKFICEKKAQAID